MKLLEMNPFELHGNPWNSNKVNRTEFDKLKKSLDTYGAFKPIVVRELEDDTLQILGGYHRNEAAKELGWLKVPVVNLGTLSDDKAKEIGLIDNTRYGQDDKELLDKILDELTDLAAFEDLIPEFEGMDLPEEDTLVDELVKEKEIEAERDETHKTLKFKCEVDKAEEIEAVLSKVAFDHDYTHSDGYSDFAAALYHILVIDR